MIRKFARLQLKVFKWAGNYKAEFEASESLRRLVENQPRAERSSEVGLGKTHAHTHTHTHTKKKNPDVFVMYEAVK